MMRTELAAPPSVFRAPRIAKLSGGRVVRASGGTALRVCTDTRQLRRGDCFIALVGDRFDGHDYLQQAFEAGAAGVVVSRPLRREDVPPGMFAVRVPDTLAALQAVAAGYRSEHPARVVGITGSCGKTSTKDMLGPVLERAMPTVRSPHSYNNQIGVPLTLFLLRPDTEAAIVEIGTSEPGEIARLASIAAPDIAIVTCVAEAHLQGLMSLSGVAAEKSALVQALRPDGVAILNGDDEACRAMAAATTARPVMVRIDREADWFATQARAHGMGTTFLLQGERPVTLPRLGTHNVYNALFTIAAAAEMGLDLDVALDALCALPPTARRLEPKVAGGVTVFDDTYNMNPASARAGLRALAGLAGSGRRVVVFGGMMDLGERSDELHQALGADVAAASVDLLVSVGDEAGLIVDGARTAGLSADRTWRASGVRDAVDALVEQLQPGDRVLCKASRGFELDRLVDGLVARLGA
ncbi:MAG: UDP-N-acetylmuramoyl-tripeptide--D-alanyl-D-alanine ligase [Planctomycetota bacterium]